MAGNSSVNAGQPRERRMNKRFARYFLVLFLVNLWVVFAIGLSSRLAEGQWQATLGIEEGQDSEELNYSTYMAIRTGILWPAAFLAASSVGLILSIWSRLAESRLFSIFSAIALLELATMALHILCLLLPNMQITYGLGP